MAGDFDLSDQDYREEQYRITEKGLGYLLGATEERARWTDAVRLVLAKYSSHPAVVDALDTLRRDMEDR